MFSSTSNNSLANFSYSNHHFPSLFAGHDTNNVLLNYELDPVTGLLLPANPRIDESCASMGALAENAAITRADIESLKADYYDPSNFVSNKRPAVRKDRHSKIFTAQGLRDRRVRLSIEIAREFFGLQDMLGFDKASQTLEWLLIKSRKAIKEVAQVHDGARCLYSASDYGVVSENYDMEMEGTVSKTKVSVEEKKMEKFHKDSCQLLAKESRDKARARARQRTKEKMCGRRLNKCQKGPDTSTQILTQLRSFSHRKPCQELSSYAHNTTSSLKAAASHEVEEPSSHALTDLDVIEVSNEPKRKLNSSSVLAYQQVPEMSKDVNCNAFSNSNYNLTQNWDVNSAIPYSTFRATTNMNLSAGLQICGKIWETRNSQCQY